MYTDTDINKYISPDVYLILRHVNAVGFIVEEMTYQAGLCINVLTSNHPSHVVVSTVVTQKSITSFPIWPLKAIQLLVIDLVIVPNAASISCASHYKGLEVRQSK